MRKFTLTMFVFLLACAGIKAQSSCSDLNGFVNSKNIGGTGAYTLTAGLEEKAAQTYYYSGPGKITSVRVYGNYPGMFGGVALRVGIYNVDGAGRPTTLIQSVNDTWWWFDNFTGYITVYFPGGGVVVEDNFAITVELRNAAPWGTIYQLQYTGNGEGLGQDLASLAGTSTGNNWASAKTSFNKDGDFYLVPKMTNYLNADFSMSTNCVVVNETISFSNFSTMTLDSMFNTIGLSAYSGSLDFYDWDFGDGSPISHAVNPTHIYTSGSTHTVTLTCHLDGWNNDCSVSISKVVSVGLSLATSNTSATCNGTATGSITLSGSGGATPYLYSLNGSTPQSSGVFNNLEAGNYTAVITDNLGCQQTETVTITEPTPIVVTNVSSTNSSCGLADGALYITATGGVGTLTYQLNSNPYQATGTFTGLTSDIYTIHVKDANGCIHTSFAAVNDQGAPTLTIVSQTNVSCNGGNNGTIVMIGTGGSGTLQYSANGGLNWQTSGTFLNQSAGVHLVMVKDATGCSYATEVELSQPPAITFQVSSTPVSCNGGSDGTITLSSVVGGTGTLTFSLNGVNFQSGNVFTGLPEGYYTAYVHDIAGCQATLPIYIGQPIAIAGSAVVTNATCHDSYTGSLTINASGGTPGYLYSIDGESFQASNYFNELDAGTYVVTIRDENGCQHSFNATITENSLITTTINVGSSTCGNANGTLLAAASGGSGSGYTYSINGTNFYSSGAFSGLVSGTYNLIIRDGIGCENVYTFSIIDANGPSITSTSHTNVGCYGGDDGTITINTVTGGTGTLQYSVNGSLWQSSPNFTGLSAGTYSVLVRDVNGCVGETSIVLTQPNAIIVTTSVTNVTCHGDYTGSVTILAAGGAGTLAYGLGIESGFQSSNVFNNLSAGNYLAMVRDAAGCIGYAYFTIIEPNPIVINVTTLTVDCYGNNDGALHITASGGTGALTYSINGIFYQNSQYFELLAPGVYSCYVKDANGCVAVVTATITQPQPLVINSNVVDVICAGGNNGVIDLMVLGGTYPYTYFWSNGYETEDIFNLVAGTYSVTVTDANGCTYSQSFIVNQPINPMVVNGVVTDATAQTASDGNIDITVSGGSGPYTYSWSNGAITQDISNLTPGVYLVTITDANGCVTSGVYIVSFAIGINQQSVGSEAVSLYPNPTHGNFTIDAGTLVIDKYEIMDMLGQVVYTAEPKTTKPDVNTESFSHGVYFVRLYINGETIIKRVEVSK